MKKAGFQALFIAMMLTAGSMADEIGGMSETPIYSKGTRHMISGGALLAQTGTTVKNYEKAVAVRIIKDTEGPQISIPTVPELAIGSGLWFSLGATDNTQLDSVEVKIWTGIGSCSTITATGSYIIPSQYITTKGMRIEVTAVDYVGNRNYEEVYPRLQIGTKRGRAIRTGSWTMAAIPGKLDSLDVAATLTARWGKSDKTNWRAVRWNGSRYVEAGETGFKLLKSGEAFWLHPAENEYLDIGSVDAFELKDTVLRIRPGWNQIGSPFKFDINNKRVRLEDSTGAQIPYAEYEIYRTEYNDTAEVYDNVPIKAQGEDYKDNEGYWIKNTFQGDAYIRYLIKSDIPATKENKPSWMMRIGTLGDRYNYVGDAEKERSMEEPPSIAKKAGSIDVEGTKGVFKRIEQGQIFRLNIEAKEENKDIEWTQNTEAYAVGIINSETGQELVAQGTRGAGRLGIIENDKVYVVAGTAEYYAQKKKELTQNVPSVTELKKTFPNPFNPSITIEYSLKPTLKMWDVSIRIYNIKGQVVRIIAEGKEKPGYKAARWDGKDRRNMAAATGMYLIQFRARSGNQECSKTIKSLMVK